MALKLVSNFKTKNKIVNNRLALKEQFALGTLTTFSALLEVLAYSDKVLTKLKEGMRDEKNKKMTEIRQKVV